MAVDVQAQRKLNQEHQHTSPGKPPGSIIFSMLPTVMAMARLPGVT